ncbi:hypothetical protein EPO34_03300 [Patescibacteria group bacterium]|nr:MAG: hypothetical protein EPO34_03300 [Patescibacteria group bacterium]
MNQIISVVLVLITVGLNTACGTCTTPFGTFVPPQVVMPGQPTEMPFIPANPALARMATTECGHASIGLCVASLREDANRFVADDVPRLYCPSKGGGELTLVGYSVMKRPGTEQTCLLDGYVTLPDGRVYAGHTTQADLKRFKFGDEAAFDTFVFVPINDSVYSTQTERVGTCTYKMFGRSQHVVHSPHTCRPA